MVFETFFGETVINNQGEKFETSSLEGKYVLIYFSAHWCGPCRGFTPRLAEFYKELKSERNDFELIFASSDRSQEDFNQYFAEMPWLSIPFEKRDLKETLSRKYKVQGIPTLVVLDKDGNLITTKGREKVSQDPKAASFPWHPVPLSDLIGSKFVAKGETPVEKDLKGKITGLYFSAHWCGPCRSFTPKLSETYNELKKEGKDFEIVFVSFDRSEDQFKEYVNEMPWVAVPFSEESRRNELGELFEVEGIPSLVFLDENQKVITKNGVASVRKGTNFPYYPNPIDELDGETIGQLNEEPCLLVFVEENQVEDVKKSLLPLAQEFQNAKKGITFLVAGNPEISQSVIKFGNLSAERPLVVLFDIPAQAKYLADSKEISPEAIRKFAEDYLAKTLTAKKIRE